MKSLVVKRSIAINGHKTSVSIEDDFWNGLKTIAKRQGDTLSDMVAAIDRFRDQNNLSSAIRLFVLDHLSRPPVAANATGIEGPARVEPRMGPLDRSA